MRRDAKIKPDHEVLLNHQGLGFKEGEDELTLADLAPPLAFLASLLTLCLAFRLGSFLATNLALLIAIRRGLLALLRAIDALIDAHHSSRI